MAKSETALLVMDVQAGILARFPNAEPYVEKVRATVEGARDQGMAVLFVVVGFRPGFPEISPLNKSFSALKESASPAMIAPSPMIEPIEGELIVTKKRISAFAGSDLEVVLRAKGINHLVLAGVSTSGVVLSTTREAADKDFQITVLSDLCLDTDEEVHRVLTEKVFIRQADVTSSADWLAKFEDS